MIKILSGRYNLSYGQAEVLKRHIIKQHGEIMLYKENINISIHFKYENTPVDITFKVVEIHSKVAILLIEKWEGFKGYNNENS